jgi:hypothetical protein
MYSSTELAVDRFAILCTFLSVVSRYPHGARRGHRRALTHRSRLLENRLPKADKPGSPLPAHAADLRIRGFSKLLEQRDRQGEVATGECPTLLTAREDIDLREIALREAAGSRLDARTVLECGQDVGLGAVRFGVLDKDVAGIGERLGGRGVNVTSEAQFAPHLAQETTSMLARDCNDKGKVRSPRNRACKLGTRPTGCACQACLEHHGASFQRTSRA